MFLEAPVPCNGFPEDLNYRDVMAPLASNNQQPASNPIPAISVS